MRVDLMERYLRIAIRRTNSVTRHLRGELPTTKTENPTVQVIPGKESLPLVEVFQLFRDLELEVEVLSAELDNLPQKINCKE